MLLSFFLFRDKWFNDCTQIHGTNEGGLEYLLLLFFLPSSPLRFCHSFLSEVRKRSPWNPSAGNQGFQIHIKWRVALQTSCISQHSIATRMYIYLLLTYSSQYRDFVWRGAYDPRCQRDDSDCRCTLRQPTKLDCSRASRYSWSMVMIEIEALFSWLDCKRYRA